MTTPRMAISSFDKHDVALSGELLAAAVAVTTRAANDDSENSIVIVLHPQDDDHQVLSGGCSSAMRAAVSVAVAAGNYRLWSDQIAGEVCDRPINSMPEVLRSAATGCGVQQALSGVVRGSNGVECLVFWFSPATDTPHRSRKAETLNFLAAACARDQVANVTIQAELDKARASAAASAVADADADAAFDPDDPDFDALTGLASKARFDKLLGEQPTEEVTLLIIDLDQYNAVNDARGVDIGDRVLVIVAQRILDLCRKRDIVGRLDGGRFGVIFADTDRATSLNVSKRLLASIAEPLPDELGVGSITATVGLAHQMGLVDLEELFDSAEEAATNGRRAGNGRIVIAA
jgi:diguanylate cyclase (GGDEF)-like protein